MDLRFVTSQEMCTPSVFSGHQGHFWRPNYHKEKSDRDENHKIETSKIKFCIIKLNYVLYWTSVFKYLGFSPGHKKSKEFSLKKEVHKH